MPDLGPQETGRVSVVDTMIIRIPTSILAASAFALAIAAPASAAPNRTTDLSATKTSATWDGTTATSFNAELGWFDQTNPAGTCHGFPGAGPAPSTDLVDYCDETLVKLNDSGPGTLDVQLPTAGDGNVTDWDLFVYTADADGTPGDLVGSSENIGGAEDVPVDEAEGNYLVVAVPYQSVNDTFTGAVKFTPADPSAAAG
jgi:hypothetical protein